MSAILGLLKFLPAAIDLGVAVKDLITDTTGKAVPTTAVETYATNLLKALTAAIEAGQDIKEAVDTTNNAVRAMLAEKRQPSDAEWASQAQRILALENRLDAAAAPR